MDPGDHPSTSHKEDKESKKEKTPAKIKETKKFAKKPFDKLMDGVVFVMSGFQNPLRGNLRQKVSFFYNPCSVQWP